MGGGSIREGGVLFGTIVASGARRQRAGKAKGKAKQVKGRFRRCL